MPLITFIPPRSKSPGKNNNNDKQALKWDKEIGARTMPYQKSKAIAAFASQYIEDSPPASPDPKSSSPRRKLNKNSSNVNSIKDRNSSSFLSDPNILTSIELLQTNYEKNLGVIEKLFYEKREMERKIRELELKVGDKSSRSFIDIENELGEAVEKTKKVIEEEEAQRKASSKRFTPSEAAAEIFNASDIKSRPKSASEVKKNDIAKKFRVSSSEEADISRYVQKQQFLRMREKEIALEKKKYEAELRERTLRASKGSRHSVDDMLQRQHELSEKSREKFLKKKESLDTQMKEKADEIIKKRQQHLNKRPPIDGLSWKEIEEINETKRKERVEKRKLELSQMLSAPTPGTNRPESQRKNSIKEFEPEIKPFRAENPGKIAMRLSNQQKLWEEQLERMKAKNKEKFSQTSYDPVVLKMEERSSMLEKQKLEKQERRRLEENKKLQMKLEEEKKRQEKLLNTKVPEVSRRLTKAAENRAIEVRKLKEEEERKKAREEERSKKQEKKLKIAAVTVKSLVDEFDRQRKSKPGYVELRSSSDNQELEAKAREEFRAKYRANKKRIMDATKEKPSLIERHNKAIAASRAKQDALNKVSSVVRESMGNKESRSKSKGEEEEEEEEEKEEEEKSRKENHYISNKEEEYKYEFD